MKEKKFNKLRYLWVVFLILGLGLFLSCISNLADSNLFLGLFCGTLCIICIFIMGFLLDRAHPELFKSTKNSESTDSNNLVKSKYDETTKLKKCIHCGSLCKIDATECESCGGNEFKKHKL